MPDRSGNGSLNGRTARLSGACRPALASIRSASRLQARRERPPADRGGPRCRAPDELRPDPDRFPQVIVDTRLPHQEGAAALGLRLDPLVAGTVAEAGHPVGTAAPPSEVPAGSAEDVAGGDGVANAARCSRAACS